MPPVPAPAFVSVTVYVFRANVAVTFAAAAIVTSHVGESPEHAPDQPVNVESAAGSAVSVTIVLCSNVAVQLSPHEMPAGVDVTVPEPVPAFVTASSNVLGAIGASGRCLAGSSSA